MKGISFKNKTNRDLIVIVEPIAEEYKLLPDDKIEVKPPMFLDKREIIDINVNIDEITIFVPEEAEIYRNGQRVGPDN